MRQNDLFDSSDYDMQQERRVLSISCGRPFYADESEPEDGDCVIGMVIAISLEIAIAFALFFALGVCAEFIKHLLWMWLK